MATKKDKYKVIKYFIDLEDNNHEYNVGVKFPRGNKKATPERLAELSGSRNRQGKPLIEKVEQADNDQ
ncbi:MULTISPECIES: hypothetical protein [Staphylococcus]|uniref:hypothetical protein n=1 Tax=Staphylococcus TaxID=1279 RepID=UPI000E68833B|nr:hypothetical protein [Staphylococcus saprophyticus]RIO25448.1 hypothetical protein BUZ82_05480 [Staphylococcus saprophyticus]